LPRCRLQLWASCFHTCASVTEQYNLVPANGRWCSVGGKVTAGLSESNGSLYTAEFIASVTCGLTAEDRDQPRDPTLVSSMRLPLPRLQPRHCNSGETILPCDVLYAPLSVWMHDWCTRQISTELYEGRGTERAPANRTPWEGRVLTIYLHARVQIDPLLIDHFRVSRRRTSHFSNDGPNSLTFQQYSSAYHPIKVVQLIGNYGFRIPNMWLFYSHRLWVTWQRPCALWTFLLSLPTPIWFDPGRSNSPR